jgi:hypothetical protein
MSCSPRVEGERLLYECIIGKGARVFSLTRLLAEGMGRVAERPDDVRMSVREYRFDEAVRSA